MSSPSDYFEILTATGDPICKEAWPGIDDYGDDHDPPDPPRRLHRRPRSACSPQGMVQARPQAGDRRGPAATTPSLTFANGETVEADLVVGADGIKSIVRQQLFSDQEPVFSGEHAYRAVISADAAHGMVVDDNLRMYIGRGTKVYLLPLRHRDQVSFDITALAPDGTWAPTVTKDDLLAQGRGLRRADRAHRPRAGPGRGQRAARSTTSTRSTPGTRTPSS